VTVADYIALRYMELLLPLPTIEQISAAHDSTYRRLCAVNGMKPDEAWLSGRVRDGYDGL
jgi:hypothetical protein